MISHRHNEVLRVLTVFTVLLLPLTLIASVFGMNVVFPGAGTHGAFWVILARWSLSAAACSAFSAGSAGSSSTDNGRAREHGPSRHDRRPECPRGWASGGTVAGRALANAVCLQKVDARSRRRGSSARGRFARGSGRTGGLDLTRSPRFIRILSGASCPTVAGASWPLRATRHIPLANASRCRLPARLFLP